MRPLGRPTGPHIILIQRLALLTVFVFLAVFFTSHGMRFLCFILLPLFYLLSQSAYPDNPNGTYENINKRTNIIDIVDAIPNPDAEPSAWLSKIFTLIWPHVFQQKRMDKIKEQLQAALDSNQSSGQWQIKIIEFDIGDRAPQITMVRVPQKPLPAKHSILYEIQMLYYPEFKLKCQVTPPTMPSFNITFEDPSFDLDLYCQYEFTPRPFMEGVPYITAIVVSLIKPPHLHHESFKVTLFSGSNILNRDFVKKAIGDAISSAAWGAAGMPNGFVLEQVTGNWQTRVVHGTKGMIRCSLSKG
jgi:hypothetical protein